MIEPHPTPNRVVTEANHPVAPRLHRSLQRLAMPLVYIAIAIVLTLLIVAILKGNHGTFTYTLDDPYIHLALSDQIRHGNYGLYPGTHAAPSSSILFPFLLAMLSGTPLHPYFPLILNIVSLFLTVAILNRFFQQLNLGDETFAVLTKAAALVLIPLSCNLIGVVFTGLEHNLHAVLVAATVFGLATVIDKQRMPGWLPIVLVLAPLVRYEGFALSVGAILVVALVGRVRVAAFTFAALVMLLAGFSFFLVKLGLSPLPSSIMVKSAVASGGEGGLHLLLSGLMKSFDTMIGHPVGLPILIVGTYAAARFTQDLIRRGHPWTSNGLMALPLFCLVSGQALAGRFGWLERYEDYLLLGVCMIGIFQFRHLITFAMSPERKFDIVHRNRFVLAAGTFVALLIVGARYVRSTSEVPAGARDVYEQQLQMHRFIDGYYRGPVAVNDLGLVSYHNPYPVLDLGGLGSEKARLMIAHHATASEYGNFVAQNKVHLVMVYQEWFPEVIPAGWAHVATMALSGSVVSAGEPEVQFYATDPETAQRVQQELTAFRSTLPKGVSLTFD